MILRLISCLAALLILSAVALLSQPGFRYSVTRLDGDLEDGVRVDANTAIIHGPNSLMMYTTDKGVSWSHVQNLRDELVQSIAIMPTSRMVVFGSLGRVGNVSFPYALFERLPDIKNQIQKVKQSCPISDTELICIDIYGDARRYVVGDTLLRDIPGLSRYNVRCIVRLRTGVIMAGTTIGVIRSLDSGKTWSMVRSEPAPQSEVVYAHVTDSDTAVFAFCDFLQKNQRLLITGDSGKTWKRSATISTSGPILWYQGTKCLMYDAAGVRDSNVMRPVCIVDYLFNPIARVAGCTYHSGNYYVSDCRATSAIAFDAKNVIAFGVNKTIAHSTDGGSTFSIQSHMANPGVQEGADFTMTRTYDHNVVSWAGPAQMYSTSRDGGVTWFPQLKTTSFPIMSRVKTADYKLLSPTCFIGSSSLRRLDISKDGGRTFEHPGLYNNDGSIDAAEPDYTTIYTADSVLKVTDREIYIVGDSCRLWKKVGIAPIYLYNNDSLTLSNDLRALSINYGYIVVWIEASRYNMIEQRWTYRKTLLLRSKDYFKTMDTILALPAGSGSFGFRTRGDSVLVFSNNSTYYLSKDIGETWDTLQVSDVPREVWMRIPRDSVYVFRQGDNVAITCDSGRTWYHVPPPSNDPNFEWNVVGFSKRRAFVASKYDFTTALYRIDFAPDSGITQSVEAEPPSKPPPVWVRASIPNPFSTIVSFTIGAAPGVPRAEVQVGVYSIDGRKITDLSSEYMQHVPGENGEVTLQWDGAQAAQGIYRIVVQSPQGTQSVSVIKAR